MSDIIKRVYESFHGHIKNKGAEIIGPMIEFNLIKTVDSCEKFIKKRMEEKLKNDCWMLPEERAELKKRHEAYYGPN